MRATVTYRNSTTGTSSGIYIWCSFCINVQKLHHRYILWYIYMVQLLYQRTETPPQVHPLVCIYGAASVSTYRNSTTGTSSGMYIWCSFCINVQKLHHRYILWYVYMVQLLYQRTETPPQVHALVYMVQLLYLVFIRMPGESYRKRPRFLLLCLCDVFRVLINCRVCSISTGAPGLVLFQINRQADRECTVHDLPCVCVGVRE